jgi:hypothetical protein
MHGDVQHGYFLTRIGAPEHFLAITASGTDWTTDIHAASRFDRWRDAYNQSVALMINDGPIVDIVERTVPCPQTADANPEDKIAKSREEQQAELKKQAAEYFAQHGHKVPLRRKGYGMRPFGGIRREPFGISVADKLAGVVGEAAAPSVEQAPELNAPAPSAASPSASTSAEEAEAMRPFRPAFGRPTWP